MSLSADAAPRPTKLVCQREFPIVVRNAFKSYRQSETRSPVLVDLNLTVPQGAIYGLLGPSGCGKTTLLKCIIGRLCLDKGLVLTCNQVPGTAKSGIPGRRLGYMPQEEALDGVLRIKELFHYYGRILGVEEKIIKKKTKFWLDFLKLPSKNSLFSTLSGGEKRRVSFAVALIHDAELFILDEPTVGVDPIVKESIWNYLFELVQDGTKSVLITTHYIEEARAANIVGMMFDGHMLAEDSPESLISRYQRNTLEDVFLSMCIAERKRSGSYESVAGCNTGDITPHFTMSLLPVFRSGMGDNITGGSKGPGILAGSDKNYFEEAMMDDSDHSMRKWAIAAGFQKFFRSIHWTKLIAITQRNFIQLFRYPGLFLLIMVLPSFQLSMCGLAFGRHIQSLNFGVVTTDSGHLAGKFLSLLDSRIIVQKNSSTWEAAYQSAVNGKTWGAMQFGPEFSSALLKRLKKAPFISHETLINSVINVSLDGTNFLVSETIRFYLSATVERFIIEVLTEENMNTKLGAMPLQMDEPIFGRPGDPHNNFIMPAFIIAASFFAQLGLSIVTLFLDKEGGKLERIFITGVTSFEIICGFMILQVIVLLAQIVILLVTALVIFDFTNQGSLLLVIALTIIQGICGITLGLFISAITSSFTSAAMVGVPVLVLSAGIGGYFWPVEAMSDSFKIFCRWMPFAVPATAMRHIMHHRWDLLHPEIQLAFGVTLVWTFLFLALALISFRFQKKA